jgi:lipopolysaccharide transport system permease protein
MNFRDQNFDTVITPRGVKRRPRTLEVASHELRKTFLKVLHLIRLTFQQQAFGLTLGHLWLLLEPALQAAAYYFLLKVVFGIQGQDARFAFFFVGITFWRSHAVLVTGAPFFFLTKGQQYIEQSLSLATAYIELAVQEAVLFLMRFVVVTAFLIGSGIQPAWTWAFGIIVAVVMFSFSMAVTVWVSLAGVYFKDISKLIGHAVWLWWYMSPGLYSISRIPEWFRPLYDLNPFAHIMPALHAAMLEGVIPSGYGLSLTFIISLALLWSGWVVLRRVSYGLYRFV